MPVYKDLLGHSLEKFGAVTVFDATFYDANDRPLITFDTLTVSNISTESEQKEIRGGQGAALLVSYDYGKTATVEITDALASIYSLRYLWGAQITSGKVTALAKKEIDLTGTAPFTIAGVAADSKVTLLVTDNKGKEFYEEIDEPTVTSGVLTVAPTASNAVKAIVYYTKEVDGTGSHMGEIILTSTDFPPIVKLVGETFFIDAKTGKRVEAQIEIPRFKLDANFELTFEAEGDASVFDFSGTALADGNEILKLKLLGYEGGDEDAFENKGIESGINPEPSV